MNFPVLKTPRDHRQDPRGISNLRNRSPVGGLPSNKDDQTIFGCIRSPIIPAGGRFYRGFRKVNAPDMLHNRGSFEYGGQKIAWEIYCADLKGQGNSPNPANLNLTQQHMMILLEE